MSINIGHMQGIVGNITNSTVNISSGKMTRQVFTHEHHHLGDQMIHLHLLRALAKQHQDTFFTHFCHACHHENLREVIADLPNILLASFESPLWSDRKHESIGVWKNEGDEWVNSPNRWNWSQHTLDLHARNARKMGFTSPFTRREELLFDYPALEIQKMTAVLPENSKEYIYDFLIGDSAPSSGQYSEWADHSREPLQFLIDSLRGAGHEVLTTSHGKRLGWSVSYLGKISRLCRHHVMVPNGPFWGTLSTGNNHHHEGRRRIVLLDNGENLNMPHIEQVPNVEAVMEIAKEVGWI